MLVINNKDTQETFQVAIVVSRFNEQITQALADGALTRLKDLAFGEHQITVVWVPGAVEIPLTAQRLARTNRYEAVICLGAVIRGETSHYDYVCEQVSQGCQRVALEQNIPVIFGVLTTEDVQQAKDRIGGSHGHKGEEAVDAAVEMVTLLRELSKKQP